LLSRSEKRWNKVFEINVTGTLRGIQTGAPLMNPGTTATNSCGTSR